MYLQKIYLFYVMETTTLLLILLLGFWYFGYFSESFAGGLTQQSHDMCNLMAGANCRIPTWQLSDCWLNAYRKCKDECGNNNCACDQRASDMCRSNDAPAEACYQSVYQKCMAGRVPGFPDPDR